MLVAPLENGDREVTSELKSDVGKENCGCDGETIRKIRISARQRRISHYQVPIDGKFVGMRARRKVLSRRKEYD